MYQCQLNLEMFCATSALDISWQHLNHPNLPVLNFYVRRILHNSGISLPREDDVRLKILILKVHIPGFVIIKVLMQL